MDSHTSKIGKKYGMLTVVSFAYRSGNHKYFNCICDCGNTCVRREDALHEGRFSSCGCTNYNKGIPAHNRKDLTGMRFGKLLVLRYADTSGKKARWLCRCDCGNEVIVEGHNLLSGQSYQCQECGYKQTSEKMKGKRNPAYKEDLPEEQRQARIKKDVRDMSSPKYRKWKWDVIRRDNYTCQICGKKMTKGFVVHHIVGWDEDESKRYDMDNGLTLCKDCHIKLHYGDKDNENT